MGVGESGGWGSTFPKVREISRTVEKIDKKGNPHPIRRGGGEVRGENVKVTKHQVLTSISGMQLSWAKPGNPMEGGQNAGTNRREGREGGERGERGRGREGPERSRVTS